MMIVSYLSNFFILIALSMNFISWNKVYSLYPQTTFEDEFSLVLAFPTASVQTALQKYVNRGFPFLPSCSCLQQLYPSLGGQGRQVGDSYPWIIPLNTMDVNYDQIHGDFCPGIIFLDKKVSVWKDCSCNQS